MTPSLSGLPPIRTALIGYGFAGKTFHAPLIRAVPALCLEHVVSRDPGRVHADLPEARVSADPDEAIEAADIDLVVIASPNATHASLAERALRASKHVVVDKPFTVTLAEARRLAVEAALQAGSIGPVRYFESAIERFRPQVRDRWREHDLPGSGLWFDLGPHLLDQALCLFGVPQRVHGHLRRLREGALTDDWFEVLLDYPHCQVALRASMLAANPAPRFNVHGDHGSLLKAGADIQEAQLLQGLHPGSAGWGRDPDLLQHIDGQGLRQSLVTPAGDQSRYYQALAAAIRGQSRNPVSAQQACALMALLELARRSAEEGRSLPVELRDEERQAWN
ncbi:Gfo/Idh/MocA family oxidoreductase [Pseudomonas aeruginosa]|uniref:Gfo/Idh/MocA family oxidoreductase n=1 Tax=Pseudomonas aeruginosa TaxID=287 RepID=UPI0005132979|nr:Gfo/Idh/MocA family oxidoreductase [Pseudomonas aeruginosa]KHE61023.1 dehydrogenase [Pseudomonas aeruginosa]KSP90275.1 dehydrogenase [Pseudomonas aeruginosa]MBX6191066.1 Gfo/Idh/MocA family oxidoreductase [Pseudomonas aeruginosa]MBX6715394.1 Gfo/Idh/MocA family oxidoreductase [Pseudomonas aeruginosa]MBX6871374.1 Gfo/Idh/MocA family oxidoreductase [Pseudomonas aeruginosa]